MPWEVQAGLTGQGFVPLVTVLNPVFERSAVTALGAAEALDPAAPRRYLHLGWWCFYEDVPVGSYDGPSGLYMAQYHFLNFERENWADDTSVQSEGYSGFFYRLFPGVEVTLAFFQP